MFPRTPFKSLFTAAGDDSLDLLDKMLVYDPYKRITSLDVSIVIVFYISYLIIYQALDHFYFRNKPHPSDPSKLPRINLTSDDAVELTMEKEQSGTKRKLDDGK
jgi:cyclin-dependent kinase 7